MPTLTLTVDLSTPAMTRDWSTETARILWRSARQLEAHWYDTPGALEPAQVVWNDSNGDPAATWTFTADEPVSGGCCALCDAVTGVG